jgi:hypothetical protein
MIVARSIRGGVLPADAKPASFWRLYPTPLFVFLLFCVLAVILAAPVSVTQDGYSHLYSATMLKEMARGDKDVHRYFSYNSALLPNWTCALLLASLSSIVSGEAALKLLIILVWIVLLSSLYFCIDVSGRDRNQRAKILIILLPFALNGYLTLGFYGFLISTSLCLAALGLIFRHGMRMPPHLQFALAGLLLCGYFSNPLPVLISFLFPVAYVASEELLARRNGLSGFRYALRKYVPTVWPWIPPACLIVWFSLRLSQVSGGERYSAVDTVLHRAIALLRDAAIFISPSAGVGTLFVAILGILLAGVLPVRLFDKGRPNFTMLAILALSCTFLYLTVPDSVGDGSMIGNRFLLHSAFYLVLLALTSGILSRQVVNLCCLIAAVTVLGFAGEYLLVSRTLGTPARELRAAMNGIPNHARTLVLAYRMTPSCQGLPLLERTTPDYHLALSGALQNELIVLNDYQARTSHFPLRYQGPQSFAQIDTTWAMTLDEVGNSWRKILAKDPDVDYIVSWGIPSGPSYCENAVAPPIADYLSVKHELVYFKDGASRIQLWRKRG